MITTYKAIIKSKPKFPTATYPRFALELFIVNWFLLQHIDPDRTHRVKFDIYRIDYIHNKATINKEAEGECYLDKHWIHYTPKQREKIKKAINKALNKEIKYIDIKTYNYKSV